MTRPEAARHLDEISIVALTLHHEAGGEGVIGMTAVACVLRNRVRWGKWGPTYADACLASKQFSCWIPAGGTANYTRLVQHADAIRAGRRPSAMASAYTVAEAVLAGTQEDITGGADHYWAPLAMRPAGRVPSWAEGQTPTAVIGRHVFIRLRPVWPPKLGDMVKESA